MHLHRGASRPTLAIVGGESLLGKEVRELLESKSLGVTIKLIAGEAEDDSSIIAAGHDEPVVINSIQMADLAAARIVVLAGTRESSRKAYEQVQPAAPAPVLIDLNADLEDQPGARLRAPMAEASGVDRTGGVQVIAHPAAIAIATFLVHLSKAGVIRRVIIDIFEPASERGQSGIDELQKQTVALLSFKSVPKEVFDAQVAFNLTPEYGSDSVHKLADVEARVDRHLASLLAAAKNVPMPSFKVIHAPVFHGYCASIWAEFGEKQDAAAIVAALTSSDVDVRIDDQEPPTNVGVAGQSGITVGAITPDRNQPRAVWFWLAADNLRIAAENAVEVVREFIR